MDEKEDILININSETNRYEIYGFVNGESVYHYVPIRGFDHAMTFQKSYNRREINIKRKNILYDIEEMSDKDELDLDRIKVVDTTLYQLLYEYDQFYRTNYTNAYIKTVMKKIPMHENESRKHYKWRSALERNKELSRKGLKIRYNLSLFKKQDKDTTLIDRIKGIFMAKKQNNELFLVPKIKIFGSNKQDIRNSVYRYVKLEESSRETKELMQKADSAMANERSTEIDQLIKEIIGAAKRGDENKNPIISAEENKKDVKLNKERKPKNEKRAKRRQAEKEKQREAAKMKELYLANKSRIDEKAEKRRERREERIKQEEFAAIQAEVKKIIEEEYPKNKEPEEVRNVADKATQGNEEDTRNLFHRKVESKSESIRNKRFMSNGVKKRVIAGALSLVAGLGVFTAIHFAKNSKKDMVENNSDKATEEVTKPSTGEVTGSSTGNSVIGSIHYDYRNDEVIVKGSEQQETGTSEEDKSNTESGSTIDKEVEQNAATQGSVKTDEETNNNISEKSREQEIQEYLRTITCGNLNISGVEIYRSVYDFGDEKNAITTIKSDSKIATNRVILLRLKDTAQDGKLKKYIYANELKDMTIEELSTKYSSYDALIGRQGVDLSNLKGQALVDATNKNSIGWTSVRDIVLIKMVQHSTVQIEDAER